MICTCPTGAALAAIPAIVCYESFGQLQKAAFQRLFSAAGAKNQFTGAADIKLKASWTAKLAAADATKITLSPYFEAPTVEAGAPREFGGGNETLGGIPEITGLEPTPFTASIRKAPQAVIAVLKTYMCENIGVYLFDENGTIGAINSGTDAAPVYEPIPVRAFYVGDKTFGNFDGIDSNAIGWRFLPNWSDRLVRVKPTDFNPLTDLS